MSAVKRLFCGVLILVACGHAYGYEYRTHNGITKAARSYLIDPSSGFQFDEDFRRFLSDPDSQNHGYGDLIDTRAGDPEENAWLDEDHEEGVLLSGSGFCMYVERPCSRITGGATCTVDHFHPPFGLVSALGGTDAVQHAGETAPRG